MATRSRTTFKKRQKELARLEKQRDKAARRMQRKLDKSLGIVSGDASDEDLEVQGEVPDGEVSDGEVSDGESPEVSDVPEVHPETQP